MGSEPRRRMVWTAEARRARVGGAHAEA